MIKTILVTGATGFVGSHLLKELVKQSYQVIILKRSTSNTWRIKDLLDKVKIYDDSAIVESKIFSENKIDCVVHLATYYKKNHRMEDIDEFIESNIKFPTRLLEQMARNNVQFFINTGTFMEYDLKSGPDKELYNLPGFSTIPIAEANPKKAYNFYAATKTAFSEILNYYANNFGIKAIDLKLFAPYGPKDNEKLVVSLINKALKKSEIHMNKGEQKWNWTYVKDIVDAYLKSLVYIDKMDSNYETFNIGNSEVFSIKEMISILENISGNKNMMSGDLLYPPREIFFVNCDNTKAKKKIGWTPKYNLPKGLEETYRYYLNNGVNQ